MPTSRRRSPHADPIHRGGHPVRLTDRVRERRSGVSLEQANALLRDGQLVRARHLVGELSPTALSPEHLARAAELLASIDRRLRSLDAVEVSLQKAELALELGDTREADRQASAARRHRAASESQRPTTELMDRVADAKRDFTPMLDSTLDNAVSAFIMGFARARLASTPSTARVST